MGLEFGSEKLRSSVTFFELPLLIVWPVSPCTNSEFSVGKKQEFFADLSGPG